MAFLTGHAPGCSCASCTVGAKFVGGVVGGAAKVAKRRAARRKGKGRPAELGAPVGELPERVELAERKPVAVEVVVTSVRELPPPRRG